MRPMFHIRGERAVSSQGSLAEFRGAGRATPPERRRPLVRPLAVGAAVFVSVLGLQLAGVLSGWLLIATGVVAALAIPTSRETSRRVFFVACIALGWAPLAWWLPFELGGVSRFGVMVAAIMAIVSALVAGRYVRARSLVPRFRSADGLTLAAAGFTTWMVLPLLTVSGGEAALRILRLGWDYAAHFNMAEMVRRTGSMVELASPGPFGPWAYADYPKGFHAAAATLMEVTVGSGIGGREAELVGFVQATALLGVAAITMVAAGLAAFPQARRHPLVAAPLIALATLALAWGPGGGSLLHFGFPNFLLATSLLACVPLIVISSDRIGRMLPLLALSGVLVGVAHNWPLLLVIAVAGLVPAVLPLRRRRWPSSAAGWTRVAVVTTATFAGILAAWSTVSAGPVGGGNGSLLLVDGGFGGGSRIETLLPPIVATITCLAGGWVFARRAGEKVRGQVLRTAAQAITPVGGLAMLAWVAAVQLSQTGTLGYYFFKLGAGVQLASVVLFAAAITVFAPLVRSAAKRGILVGGAGLAFATLLATSSGIVNLTSEAVAIRRPQGLDAREAWQRAVVSPSTDDAADAREILSAAGVVTGGAPHFWVPSRLDRSTAPRLANQWLFALTGQWSVSSYAVIDDLWGDDVPRPDRPGRPEEAVRRIQDSAPGAVVVVPPETFDRWDGDPASGGRMVTW